MKTAGVDHQHPQGAAFAAGAVRKPILFLLIATLSFSHVWNSWSGLYTANNPSDTRSLASLVDIQNSVDQMSANLQRALAVLPQEKDMEKGGALAQSQSRADQDQTEQPADTPTTPTNTQSQTQLPFHVLFGISGNSSGFISEFQVSLKSVLLNAPVDAPLDIHIMVDGDASKAVDRVLEETELAQWKTRNPISIHTYKVDPFVEAWKERMVQLFKKQWKDVYGAHYSTEVHTIGTMFRLFANELLPSNVTKMLYLDPDAILVANLQSLWNHIDPQALFQWGETMCAGFMVLDNQQLPRVWDLAHQTPMLNISERFHNGANDQLIFRAVNVTFPDRVALFEQGWDIHVADGGFRFKKNLDQRRPRVGMMHFNGGSSSKESAYASHSILKEEEAQDTWGLAHYYARMPWRWAPYWAQGTIPVASSGGRSSTTESQAGHSIVIQRHEPQPKPSSPEST